MEYWGHGGVTMGNYKNTHVTNNQLLIPQPLPQMAKYIFSENGALW